MSVQDTTYLTNCKSTHTASAGSESAPEGLEDLGSEIPDPAALEVEVAVALAEETLDLVILGVGAEEEEEGTDEVDEDAFISTSRMFFRCEIRSPRFFPSLISRCTSTSAAALAYTKGKNTLNE